MGENQKWKIQVKKFDIFAFALFNIVTCSGLGLGMGSCNSGGVGYEKLGLIVSFT